jgi:hypothetical protein
MVIILHQTRMRINFVNRGEQALSFKHRLGTKSASLSQSVTIEGLPDIVNKKFKRILTDKLYSLGREIRHDTPYKIVTPYGVFESHSRSPEQWANKLANLIIRKIKSPVKDGEESYKSKLKKYRAIAH